MASVGSIFRKLPAALSSWKKSIPAWKSSSVPSFWTVAMPTAANAAPAWVGSPLIATLPR